MLINNIIDIHAHVLPGVDDGVRDLPEALRVLCDLKAQGVSRVYATPHFYMDRQEMNAYRKKVHAAFAEVTAAAAGLPLPEICLGYEVRIFQGIQHCAEMQQMCLQDTPYLLIELPFGSAIEGWMLHELYNLKFTSGKKPIIAHIERYRNVYGFEKLMELVTGGDVYTQVTSAALLGDFSMRRWICNMVRCGLVHFIASDAHAPEVRRGAFPEANEKLAKKCGADRVIGLYTRAERLLQTEVAMQ